MVAVLPSMNTGAELSPPKQLWSALNVLRPDCSIIRGRHRSTGRSVTILRCGGTHPTEKRFFIGHIMNALDEERTIGKIPFWRIPKLAKEIKADFTLIHLDQAAVNPAEWFMKRTASEVFRPPLLLEAIVDVSDEKKLLAGKSISRDVQNVRRKAFSMECSTDSADLLSFIRNFRDPYVAKKHGLDSLNFRYDSALFENKSFAGSGFTLVKIILEGQWVAATVTLHTAGGFPTLWELGVKDGNTQLVTHGALAASYWLTVEHLIKQGAKTVSLGLVRPFINEGVFIYKSKFQPTLRIKSSRRVLIVPNLSSEIARQVLEEQPLITEYGGKLTPIGYRRSPQAPDSLKPYSNTLSRIKNLEPSRLIDLRESASKKKLASRPRRTDALSHREYPREKCIQDLFCENALMYPDQIAVRYGDKSLSYADLLESSQRLAQHLQRNGVNPGSVVAVCASRSLHLATWVIGVLRSGAAYLPLDPALPSERLQFMLKDGGAQALIVDEGTESLFEKSSLPCHIIEGLQVISTPPSSKAPAPTHCPSATDLAYIIYTSGSTGLPKGVEIEHRNIVNLVWDMKARLGLRAKERVLSIGSFAFDVTLPDWFWAFLTGGTVIIADEHAIKDPTRLVPLITKYRPTHIQATPGTWEMLLKVGLPSYRPLRLVTTGEHVSEALRERLRTLSNDAWNLYGPTETTVWSSACHLGRDHSTESIGEPIANTQFYVVSENGQLASENEKGELWIGGEGVARGYRNRPDLTDERFINPDWSPGKRLYRTGDLVEWNAEGGVRYHGRIDDQVKIRGYRIELGEIDAKLAEHPDIQISQTLLISGEHSRLISFVVPESPTSDPKSWKTFLLRELPDYMVPARLIPLGSLPLTPNGKIDRIALIAHLEILSQGSSHIHLNPLEKKVAEIWRTILKSPPILLADTFWDLGGDSLSAVHMLLELKQRLGLEVSYERLYENPTLQEFCAFSPPKSAKQARLRNLRAGKDANAIPILFTHGHNFGNSLDELLPIVYHLDASYPIWGLSGQGEDGRRWEYQTIPKMAAEALNLIKKVIPPQRIILLGYCIGGLLAYELAHQLSQEGYLIKNVIMIDTVTPKLRNATVEKISTQRKEQFRAEIRQRRINTIIERLVARWNFEQKYFTNKLWRKIAPLWIRMAPLPIKARTLYYQAVQSTAFKSYNPGTLDAPVHLIKTDIKTWPSDYGWLLHCPQIEESSISAPHHEMVSKEQATRLADHISMILEATQTRTLRAAHPSHSPPHC
jgi:amino acid adenylation domain-containing protein